MKPAYKHDCEKCKFIGKFLKPINLEATKHKVADIYESCQKDGQPFIIRCSSKGSDYITTNNIQQYM